jgi:S1-C subfamily serine protease
MENSKQKQRIVLMLAQKIFVFLFLLFSFNNYAQRRGVIYGDDDRIDPYLVKDQRLLDLTKSTVAVVQRSSLVSASSFAGRSSGTPSPSPSPGPSNSGKYTLKTTPFGSAMGLCTSERFYKQPTGAFCSGSLIGPNLVLTAGHCIESEADCKTTSFVFGFAMTSENEATTTFSAENVVHCKRIVSRELQNDGADYAVVEIDRAVTHVQPLKLADTAKLKVGTPLIVIGHPSGLPVKLSGGAAVRSLVGSDTGYFTANLDTYGGNSGSAVFNPQTGEVEGVLVRGETDFVRQGNCRVSYVCTNDGCRGEDVTKASYVKQKVLFALRNTQFQTNRTTTNGGFQNSRRVGGN